MLHEYPNREGLSGAELEQTARDVLRYVIFTNSAKPGMAITKNELLQQIMGGSQGNKKGWTAVVMARVQWQLAKVFGLELVELVKPGARKANGQQAEGTRYYILKSLVPRSMYATTVGLAEDVPTQSKEALLGVVMSLIAVAGGSLAEDELWRHLEALGVQKTKMHPTFCAVPGDIIDEFQKKRFLHIEVVPGVEETHKVYSVAENAFDYVKANEVERFVEQEMA